MRGSAWLWLLWAPWAQPLPTSERQHAEAVAERQRHDREHRAQRQAKVEAWGATTLRMPWEIEGKVDDCCCDASFVVEHSRSGGVDAVLSELMRQPFFGIFKVNLQRQCQFAGIADERPVMDDCAVGECGDEEVPTFWRNQQGCLTIAPNRSRPDCATASAKDNDVDYTVLTEFDQFPTSEDGVSIVQGGEGEDGGSGTGFLRYVNLARNPERYTGYTGYTATRVWDAIYEENCFKESDSDDAQCFEERLFFRLISGLHTSIHSQLAANFYPDGAPNPLLWQQKVGLHPDRVKNLYFTYLFVSRAVSLSLPALVHYNYSTGVAGGYDSRCNELVHELMDLPLFQSCNPTFNESLMVLEHFTRQHEAGGGLQDLDQSGGSDEFDFVQHLRNVSLIMDCIGCEKCKLWGKVQVLGVGTALKILLSERANRKYELERNEIIALFNLLAKLAASSRTVAEMSTLLTDPHHGALEQLVRPKHASPDVLQMHSEL